MRVFDMQDAVLLPQRFIILVICNILKSARNIGGQWLLEVAHSHPCPHTGYPWLFRGMFQSVQHYRFLSHTFLLVINDSPNYSTLYMYSFSQYR